MTAGDPLACIHELDVVRLRVPVEGESLAGDSVEVPVGTQGSVIVDERGHSMAEVEVSGPDGLPVLFFAASRDDLDVVRCHRARSLA